MAAEMVCGPVGIPLTSTKPIEALRIFEKGVFRMSRLYCNMRNPRKNRTTPPTAPTTAIDTSQKSSETKYNAEYAV
jgi:hypothetical protein